MNCFSQSLCASFSKLEETLQVADTRCLRAREVDLIGAYSLGGIGTFAMIRDHPDLFAAGLVLCGAWNPAQAAQFPTDVPILALRGEKDNLLDARPMIIALQKADRPAIYREYPGINHNVWDYAYPDPAIWDWLFSQQRKR